MKMLLLRCRCLNYISMLIDVIIIDIFTFTIVLDLLPILVIHLLLFQLLYVFFGQKTDLLSFLPDTNLRLAIFLCSQHSSSMLFSIIPLASVDLSIWPLERALALLNIVNKITFILAAIGPDEVSISVHFVLYPRALVFTTICPDVLSLSMDFIV